jgi:hypothetical protein
VEQRPTGRPVVITGASLGLPGTERIFDDSNVARILRGEQFIDAIPTRFRRAMLDKHITRLVKSDNGGPTFEQINNPGEVIKLAARGGAFDLAQGVRHFAERIAALDRVTSLAIAAGIDALRDAGIPLTMRYKHTSKGSQLPDRWGLPDALRDDTGVIFASVFPGFDSFADEMARYYADRSRRDQLAMLEDLSERTERPAGDAAGDRPAHRGIAGCHCERTVRVRPAFSVPGVVHGPLAVRRADRRPRPQYADQCGMREHDPGNRRGAGLDPRRTVPPGDCHLGGRHHVRPSDRVVRRGLPGQRRGGDRRCRGRGRDSVRPPAARHDHGDGRGGAGGGKRGCRRGAWAAAHLRSAGRGGRQQRLPRHPPGRPPHP